LYYKLKIVNAVMGALTIFFFILIFKSKYQPKVVF